MPLGALLRELPTAVRAVQDHLERFTTGRATYLVHTGTLPRCLPSRSCCVQPTRKDNRSMRHFKALIARKTMLSVLAVGVISAGALGGTYANFTATPVTIASNAFATGTLSIGRSGSGAIFNVSAQKIGQEATGTLTITNTGTIDGVFTGTASSTGTLAPSIKLVIYRDNDNVA